MSVREYKPTSPGRRNSFVDDFADITKSSPEKSLTRGLRKRAGRNNRGVITVRHRGGGHKRRYRLIDFYRIKRNTARVLSIEYDPNRTARIALVVYEDGSKAYVVAPERVTVGTVISNLPDSPVKPGNTKELGLLPEGTLVHNIETRPNSGAKLVRSAGGVARIMAHENNHTLLELPSGERRNFLSRCLATVGTVSNGEHKNLKLGKAGRRRHRGFRPTVRGSAMSPNAHPHGGGEGHAPIGLKSPKTPTGKRALGVRTRRNKTTNKYILRKRHDRK